MRTFRLGCFAVFCFLFLFTVLNPSKSYAGDSSGAGASLHVDAVAKPVPAAVDVAPAIEPSAIDNLLVALPDWLQLLSLVVALCSTIAALTPSPKDDSALLVVRKIVDLLALNFLGAKNASSNKTSNSIRRTDSTLP